MLTSERQRLMTMYDKPVSALAIFLKCGACLAVVMLLAVIGSARENEDVASDSRGHARKSESTAKASTAAAHRKEVFDARRARFDGKASGLAAAAGISPITHAEAFTPGTPGSAEPDRSASPGKSPSLISQP